jgi:hypothetical protein
MYSEIDANLNLRRIYKKHFHFYKPLFVTPIPFPSPTLRPFTVAGIIFAWM